MKPRHFIESLDEKKVVAAISRAEQHTTGEIRIFVSHHEVDDAAARARRRFEKLGMARSPHRNAVLIYFAPRSRKFAVVGDTAIHEKCGEAFWQEAVAEIGAHLREERFTEAVLHAVEKVGALLATHFPKAAT